MGERFQKVKTVLKSFTRTTLVSVLATMGTYLFSHDLNLSMTVGSTVGGVYGGAEGLYLPGKMEKNSDSLDNRLT